MFEDDWNVCRDKILAIRDIGSLNRGTSRGAWVHAIFLSIGVSETDIPASLHLSPA